jgi:hypothetical protein
MKSPHPAPESQPPGAAHAALEAALRHLLPGFEVLDRGLELEAGASADLVGLDAQGRVVLVLGCDGRGVEPVLGALDALAYARRNREPLQRHLEHPRLARGAAVRVLLVADKFGRSVIERLQPLLGRGIDLYELRSVRSARGETASLAPVSSLAGAEPEVRIAPAAFAAALPAPYAGVAALLVAKMQRIDGELEARATSERVEWSFRARLIARMDWSEGQLSGAAAPRFEARPLGAPAQVEAVLEDVLSHYVRMLEGLVDEPEPGAREPAGHESDARESESPRGGSSRSDPRSGGSFELPSLSRDELEAFHG